jgi:hypothetical protein
VRRPFATKVAAALALMLLGAAALAASLAPAEQSGRDGVVVKLDAEISPKRLPRHRFAPVSLTIAGGVRSSDGSALPRLARIELAFGARGGLDTAGLRRCPRARLRNATTRQALARCRGALVGRGTIVADVPLSPEEPIRARARALAFNGISGGRPAVWVQAYSAAPPVSFVLPFQLRRLRNGPYGLLLSAPVARALGRWPQLRSFRIALGRRYRAGGVLHSYLSARCPLPPRFNSLSVPLAHATYDFTPKPLISTTILRACGVRE